MFLSIKNLEEEGDKSCVMRCSESRGRCFGGSEASCD
jgi:hypothetical protein